MSQQFVLKYPKGATPLTRDELAGLIPDYIRTQGELNLLERENIVEATNWIAKTRAKNVLTMEFAYELHRRMFGNVWKWAGSPRQSDKNIGIPWQQISTQLGALFKDVETWIAAKSYSWDEIGARFHHRLVAIHAFPNGNGRHSRTMTDLLLDLHGETVFSWGADRGELPLEEDGAVRDDYIVALQEADERRYAKLVQFVRS